MLVEEVHIQMHLQRVYAEVLSTRKFFNNPFPKRICRFPIPHPGAILAKAE